MERNDICVAGIWKRDFEKNPLWNVEKQVTSSRGGSPSWSWSSVDATIHEADPWFFATTIIHVINVQLEIAGSSKRIENLIHYSSPANNPLGELSRGRLLGYARR